MSLRIFSIFQLSSIFYTNFHFCENFILYKFSSPSFIRKLLKPTKLSIFTSIEKLQFSSIKNLFCHFLRHFNKTVYGNVQFSTKLFLLTLLRKSDISQKNVQSFLRYMVSEFYYKMFSFFYKFPIFHNNFQKFICHNLRYLHKIFQMCSVFYENCRFCRTISVSIKTSQ